MSNDLLTYFASYFVNIGQGDGAIHLLYSISAGSTRKTVLKAILLDGGPGGDKNRTAQKSLWKTIDDIEWDYACDGEPIRGSLTGRKKLRFDAFVISHWDADHYSGVIYLLLEDLNEQYQKWLKDSRPTRPPNFYLSRAKYDKDGEPVSCLYAPNWKTNPGKNVTKDPKKVQKPKKPGDPKADPPDEEKEKDPHFPRKDLNDYLIVSDPDAESGKKPEFKAYLHIRAEDKDGGQGTSHDLRKEALRVQVGPEHLLGRDLLKSWDSPAPAVPSSIKNPSDLLLWNAPAEPSWPGFYCIAARSASLGPAKKQSVQTTWKNKSSICCMLIWRTDDGPHISLYSGGDADLKLESRLVTWSDVDVSKTATGRGITTVKLSHHGAYSSNPHTFFTHWDPLNVLASAGDSTYGHPRWEVLVMMEAWLKARRPEEWRGRPLWLTNYPRYFADAENYNFGSVKAAGFKGDSPCWREPLLWIRELNALRNGDGMQEEQKCWINDYLDWLRKYKMKEKKDPEPKDQLKWVYDYLREKLDTLCGNYAESPLPLNKIEFQEGTIGDIQYIKVISSNRTIQDGRVYVRYTKSSSEVAFNLVGQRLLWKMQRSIWKQKRPAFLSGIHQGSSTSDSLTEELDTISDDESLVAVVRSQVSSFDTESLATLSFFYGNELVGPPQGPTSFPVVVTNPISPFLNALGWKAFAIIGIPEKDKASIVSSEDQWVAWLKASIGVEDSALKFTPAAWPMANTTPAFAIDLKISGVPLPLETGCASLATGCSQELVNKVLSKQAVLLFGLKVSPPIPAVISTFAQIASVIGFQFEWVTKVLGPMEFQLDAENRKRNCLWFAPNDSYRTTLRLQFVAMDDHVSSWINKFLPDFKINSIILIAKKQAYTRPRPTGDEATAFGTLTFVITCTITPPGKAACSLDAILSFTSGSISLNLTYNGTGKGPSLLRDSLRDSLMAWIGSSLGLGEFDLEKWLEPAETASNLLKSVIPRSLEVMIPVGEDGNLQAPSCVVFSLQAGLTIGNSKDDKVTPIVFFYDFKWMKDRGASLTGRIWTNPPRNDTEKVLPNWEEYAEISPILEPGQTGPADNLDLKALFKVDDLPKGIPTEIAEAVIQIDKDGIVFKGRIQCSDPATCNVPALYLDELGLYAGYYWSKGRGEFFCALSVDLLLFPGGPDAIDPVKEVEDQDPARMTGRIAYIEETWQLEARVYDLTVRHLAGFWDKETYKGVESLLGRLQVNELALTYQYQKGSASEFTFTGNLSLGALYLGIEFQHTGSDWTFDISLGADDGAGNGEATIGTILTSFLEFPPELPAAIWNIKVGKPGSGSELLHFNCREVENGNTTKIIFVGSIHLSNITLSFIQWRDREWDRSVPSKRVIKAGISDIGTIEAPLVGKFEQPFDQLFYVWVQDETGKNVGKAKPGILKSEYDLIDPILSEKDKLFFREIKGKYDPGDLVLEAGSHIIVVCKDSQGVSKAILDYPFSRPETKTLECGDGYEVVCSDNKEAKGETGKAMAPLKKSVGPLSVQNICLEYKDKKLGIVLDAKFLMGPISLVLLGFGVRYPFGGGDRTEPVRPEPDDPGALGYELSQWNDKDTYEANDSFDPSKIEPTLSGLIVAFQRPPITVAGGFQHQIIDNNDCYAGGLIVGFKLWMITAVGVYSQYPAKKEKEDPNSKAFTMVFIILKVEGPLFSMGFADISGVTAGFGVNSAVKTPTVETVTTFPFVASSSIDPDESVVETLGSMMQTKWFTAADGSFWVAAGLKVSAFQMLSVDAVIVFEFNPDIHLGIYGVAVFDAPNLKSPVKFAHVELGLICVLDIQAGVFKVEAQMSPNSYILHPSCHLTGGFAFYSWFKSKDGALAGDWVLTLGGYHQAFNVPSQYPQPPRLGISWSWEDALSITGEAYFAITPKLCMGGGRLHAALDLGPLSAFFDAFLDFLINYEPFHFLSIGKISVGVRFSMKMWIVTIRINVEIGATLTVAGPPMAGVVHVDFWVFGFDIKFGGAMAGKPPALLFDEFLKLVLDSDGAAAAPPTVFQQLTGSKSTAENASPSTAIFFSCVDGLVSEDRKKKKKDGKKVLGKQKKEVWVVRGGTFCFLVSFKFPIESLTMIDQRSERYRAPDSKLPKNPIYSFPEKGIYAMPMQLGKPIESHVDVEITRDEKQAIVLREPPLLPPEKGEWKVEREVKPVQSSIWGKYIEKLDPSASNENTRHILSDSTPMPSLVTAVYLTPPAPILADDTIPKFNMVSDLQQSVFDKSHMPRFPPTVKSNRDWAPRDPAFSNVDLIRMIWKKKENNPNRVAELWSKRLGYTEVIFGARPESLITRMETLVPALPMVALGRS